MKIILKSIEEACLRAKRNVSECKVICVSKNRSVDEIRQMSKMGFTHFGENYVQEAIDKMAHLSDLNLTWHMIGRMQSNKIKKAAKCFDVFHAMEDAKSILKLNDALTRPKKILIQVKMSTRNTKGGVDIKNLPDLIKACNGLQMVQPIGLMCFPDQSDQTVGNRPYFRELKQLLNSSRPLLDESKRCDFKELSMGVSDDYIEAIEEGATMVRLGRILFESKENNIDKTSESAIEKS